MTDPTLHGGTQHPRRIRMLWHTTLGKKLVVAITGLILALYVVAHMLGNLKALQGAGWGDPEVDRYAHWLRHIGGPVIPAEGVLWAVRALLLVALVLHVWAILQLTKRNTAARPRGHASLRTHGSLSARTMLWTGLLILAFVVFHILHFTTGTIHPTPIHTGEVYANVYSAFDKWWLVAIYVGAVALVGLHLHHALWSATQTAGVDNPDRNWFWRRLATVVSVSVVFGFATIPVLVFAGALPAPSPTTASAHR